MIENNRAQTDMENELSVQIRLLRKACREFDAGDYDETRNIARALRVILTSDTHGDPSLLERAGLKSKELPDTRAVTHPKNISPYFSLTGIVFGPKTVGVRALLEDAGSNGMVVFSDWLEQIICDDREGNYFSRHRLIKAVANLGGGTHFPSDIRDYYRKLEQVSVSAQYAGKQESIELRDLEKHSLRQIAFEVLSGFGEVDGRGARVEPGALMIKSMSMILYPGRRTTTSVEMKTKQEPGPVSNIKEGRFDSISGFLIKLPYEGTGRNAKCPCSSEIKFKNCCEVARDFDADFIDAFEKRLFLGKYAV